MCIYLSLSSVPQFEVCFNTADKRFTPLPIHFSKHFAKEVHFQEKWDVATKMCDETQKLLYRKH